MLNVWQANRRLNRYVKTGETGKYGMCKRRVRMAYDIPSDGSVDANAAYARTDHRFRHQWIPGAFAWWHSGTHGHVAICLYRKGYVWSVDVKRRGKWDIVKLEDVARIWPTCRFVGFSRDIEGKTPVKVPLIRRRYP